MHDHKSQSDVLPTSPACPLPTKPGPDSGRTVMTWWHLSQVIWRLARTIDWNRLRSADRRRLDAILELLEGEIHLARTTLPKTTKATYKEAAFPGHQTQRRVSHSRHDTVTVRDSNVTTFRESDSKSVAQGGE